MIFAVGAPAVRTGNARAAAGSSTDSVNVEFTGNLFDGKTCSLHIDDKPRSGMSDITVGGDVVTPDTTIRGCDAVVTHTVELTWSGSTWFGAEPAVSTVYG